MSGWKDSVADSNYVLEMLKSPTNVHVGLAAAAVGGVLALPFGLGVGLIPIVAFVAGDALAALVVPESAGFRNRINRKIARRRREKFRQYLQKELNNRDNNSTVQNDAYQRILHRISSLRDMVAQHRVGVSEQDLDRLDDASVDYLGLWLAKDVLVERIKTMSETNVQKKISSVDVQLSKSTDAANRKRLQNAHDSLKNLLSNANRLTARLASVEAALLTLPDAIEEIFHAAVTTPVSGGSMDKLSEAVAKLRFEEDLDLTLEEELANIGKLRRVIEPTVAKAG